MRAYSSANLLGKEMGWKSDEKKTIIDWIDTFLSEYIKDVRLRVTVPTTVFIRTKLLCEYIEGQVSIQFGIHNFLMLLYLDFVQSSIAKYEPMKLYRGLSKTFGYEESVEIIDYQQNEIISQKKRPNNRTSMVLTMDKKDALKGEMLLAELDELYGHEITLEKALTALWINFIEEYKLGDNNKALNTIIRMLKKQSKD